MHSNLTDVLDSALHELKEAYRSSIPMSEKHFKLESFYNHAQRMDPSPTTETIDDLLESIEPIDFPSKRLKLELANKFKRPIIILDYIKKEEKLLVKRALGFPWMYKVGLSPFSNPKTLVRIILPNVSYSTRLKIISGLSKNLKDEELCQEIFKLVQEKFGSFSALDLLPSCTKEFIKDQLKCDGFIKIHMTPQQTLKIAKKDHGIVIEYLTFLFEYLISRDSEEISQEQQIYKMYEDKLCDSFRKTLTYVCPYLCINHLQDFIKLYEKYPNLIILKRTSKTTNLLMTTCKETILLNGSTFKSILEPKKVFRILEWEDFVNFLKSFLPNQIESFLVESIKLLEWMQPILQKYQWDGLREAFLKKYNKDIQTFPEYISPTVIKLMPPDLRNLIVIQKLEFDDPGRIDFTEWEDLPKNRQGFWYSFMTLEKSIPKIKELLHSESDGTIRAELLTYLVKTCSINGKNKTAMLDICRFVLSNYRNDTYQIRNGFLVTLNQEFKLDKWMDEEIWDVLMEFIKLSEAYKEPQSQFLIVAAIRFHILKDLPSETLLNGFVQTLVTTACYRIEWNWFKDNPDLEEKFLKLTIAELAKIYNEELPDFALDSTLQIALVTLLTSIKNWKQHNRTNNFSFHNYPWLIARIYELVKTVDVIFIDIHLKILQAIRSDSLLMNSCLEIYMESCPLAPILELYLNKKDPSVIQENLSEIIVPFILELEEKDFRAYKQFFIVLKEFPDIASTVVEICLEVAQDDGQDSNQRLSALVILSYIWDSRNYLNTISLFYPSSETIDLFDEGFETKFQVKKAIVKSLTNTSYPSECLEPIEKFCIGDYVKTSVGTLFSSCLHSPRNLATKFLREQLLDKPVAVKKLTIKLLCKISDREETEELLTYLWENETHPTIREILVSQLVTFLNQTTPSSKEKSWSLVKVCLLSLIRDNDRGSLQELFMPHHIVSLSRNIIVDYLTVCLSVLSSNNKVFSNLFPHFIIAVTRNIELFPCAFLESLMTEYLLEVELEQNEQIARSVANLAMVYLFENKDPDQLLSRKIDIVSSKIIKLKSQWENTKIVMVIVTMDQHCFEKPVTTYIAKQALNNFVQEICKHAIQNAKKNPSISKQILTNLLKTINDNFDRSETFAEGLYFNLALIIVENMDKVEDDKCLFTAGQKLQELTDRTIAEYHFGIFSLYFDTVETFFREIYLLDLTEDYNINTVIYLLLGIVSSEINQQQPLSIENKIIACKLFPKNAPRTPELKEKYKELLCVISTKFDCNTVRAYLAVNKININ